jgi:hypothetical protein
MHEGNTEESARTGEPAPHEEEAHRSPPRALLVGSALLLVAGTVAMATHSGAGPSRAAGRSPAGLQEPERAEPDVIIVAIDGLGVRDVSVERTPSLAEFSAESIAYRDAYAPSPWASEALYGMVTGRYQPVPAGETEWAPGVADELQHEGYRTAAVPGHLRHALVLAEGAPASSGFDEVLLPAGIDDPAGAQGSAVVEAALGWLEQSERPALLVVTLADPRAPHDLYQGGSDELDRPDPGYDGPMQSGMAHDDLLRVGPSLNARDRAYLEALHATEVAAADAFVQQLIDGARAHRVEAPIIAIAGLRRSPLGEAGRFGLVPSMEPEDLRVPLWLQVPAPAGGAAESLRGAVSAPVSLLDLGPSLLFALGIEPRLDLDGRSVYPGSAVPERPIRAVTSRGICAAVGLDGDRAVILAAGPAEALVRSREARGAQGGQGRWVGGAEVTGADSDLRLQLARWIKRVGIRVPGGGVPDLEGAPFRP